jgi:hypothetical protein
MPEGEPDMRRILTAALFLWALTLPLSVAAGDDGVVGEGAAGGIKKGVKSIVSGVVSGGKAAVSGASEGLDEGRKEGNSLDGSSLVMNKEDLLRLLSMRVLKSEELSEGSYEITVAFKNDNDFPVRITNLFDTSKVILLDKDGFASPLEIGSLGGAEITVLPRAQARSRLVFDDMESEPAVLRFFDVETEVPAPVKNVESEG